MFSPLKRESCQPCHAAGPPLNAVAVAERLTEIDPRWQLSEVGHLTRTFPFRDFLSALRFVWRIGLLSDRQRHHPELTVRWGEVSVDLHTHKVDGLTGSDFHLAEKIDDAFARGRT